MSTFSLSFPPKRSGKGRSQEDERRREKNRFFPVHLTLLFKLDGSHSLELYDSITEKRERDKKAREIPEPTLCEFLGKWEFWVDPGDLDGY